MLTRDRFPLRPARQTYCPTASHVIGAQPLGDFWHVGTVTSQRWIKIVFPPSVSHLRRRTSDEIPRPVGLSSLSNLFVCWVCFTANKKSECSKFNFSFNHEVLIHRRLSLQSFLPVLGASMLEFSARHKNCSCASSPLTASERSALISPSISFYLWFKYIIKCQLLLLNRGKSALWAIRLDGKPEIVPDKRPHKQRRGRGKATLRVWEARNLSGAISQTVDTAL